MITTINGLHSCKPGNEPIVGQVKTFAVEHRTSRNGKPWMKIRSAPPDNGGTPYRIVSAEQTDFVDPHGNLSFNLEIESASEFQQAKAAMNLSGEARTLADAPRGSSAPHAQQFGGGGGENTKSVREAPSPSQTNGVEETRQHLMQSANLMLLAIRATTYVGDQLPEKARTGEQMQSILAQLFIEASHKRTNDGVNWFSYVDKMPNKPL